MKNRIFLTIASLSLLITACSSGVSMPKWASKVPSKDGFMYSTGSGLEDDMQQAILEAEAIARSNLAQNLEVEVSGLTERMNRSVKNRTAQSEFTTGLSIAYSANLSDTKVAKQEVVKEKGLFRAYVLLEYDLGAANDRLLVKIKSDKELYDELKVTELYKEMEDKVEAYRQRRNKK